jgi:hypothetical protein
MLVAIRGNYFTATFVVELHINPTETQEGLEPAMEPEPLLSKTKWASPNLLFLFLECEGNARLGETVAL